MTVELINDSIEKIVRNNFSELHTCMPGKIQNYNHKEQKADIKPVINRKLANGEIMDIPIITGVPIILPRSSSDFVLHFPIKKGDYVLLLFCERSIDSWVTDGNESPPLDKRRFNLTDAVAIPGLYPFKETSPSEDNDNFILKFKNSSIQISPLGVTTIDNGKSKIKIDALGRIALGNNIAELLQLFDLTLDALISDTVITPPTKALLTTIKAALLTIKGSV